MSFSIKGYQEDLKNKIESYASTLNNIKSTNTSEATGALPDNGMGLNNTQKTKLYTSGAFTVPNGTDNNATKSQTNGAQKTGSNAATTFGQFVAKTVTDAITSLTNFMNTMMQKLEGLSADKSALTAPKTTGQSKKPQENLTMDNQGTKNDSTQPKNSTTKNPETANINSGSKTDLASNTKPSDIKNETKADNKEKTTNTNEAQTSTELDKAAQKQEEKEFASAQQKLQDEAARLSNEKAA